MRVSFIQNTGVAQFGVMYISAVLKAQGHTCNLFLEGVDKNFLDAITKSKPDVVAFSCSTAEHKWLKKITALIKTRFADAQDEKRL